MGILSPTVSMTRYKVEGSLNDPFHDSVSRGLNQYSISEIDNDVSEKAVGWTSFNHPYKPGFDGLSYMFGTYLIFSLRVDKKSLSSKIVKKHLLLEETKRLSESGREFFSKNEKMMIKDQVINSLCLRTPATPNIYDLVWNYEAGWLWFFTTLKSANEELETLFSKSFKLTLIRLFPYTQADTESELTDSQREKLNKLAHSEF